MVQVVHESALKALLDAAWEGLSPKPGRAVIVPGGEPAWDDCCKGQVHVRVTTVDPMFSQQRGTYGTGTTCPIGYQVTLGVGIIRCVASLDDNGRAPKDSRVSKDGLEMVRDMNALAAVLETFEHSCILRASMGEWTPFGAQGGCAGGEWAYRIRTA